VLLAVSSAGRTLLAVLGVGSLVLGFVAIGVLAVWVLRKAPKDGTDIGRDPRLKGDEQKRRNGSGTP
jgi:hypothetical protein